MPQSQCSETQVTVHQTPPMLIFRCFGMGCSGKELLSGWSGVLLVELSGCYFISCLSSQNSLHRSDLVPFYRWRNWIYGWPSQGSIIRNTVHITQQQQSAICHLYAGPGEPRPIVTSCHMILTSSNMSMWCMHTYNILNAYTWTLLHDEFLMSCVEDFGQETRYKSKTENKRILIKLFASTC